MPRIGLSAPTVRAKAIDITLAHMRRHGFDRVRLRDVASELGVSHVALYAHFADKAALLDAVTERWLDEVNAALAAIATSQSLPVDKIRAWFVTFYRLKRERVLRDPELYRAFDAAAQGQKPVIAAHLATLKAQLLALVEGAAGQLGSEGAHEKAALLFEATTSFHHPKLVAERCTEDREAVLLRILDIVLLGFAAASGIHTRGAS